MFITPVLSSIVCQRHTRLIPLCEFEHHIRTHHKKAHTACQYDLRKLLDHIKNSAPVPLTNTKQEILELISMVRLTEPLPGLQPPQPCIQCPVCERWFVSPRKKRGGHIRGHWIRVTSPLACREWFRRQPRTFKPGSMPRIYASSVFPDKVNCTIRVTFSSDYTPSDGTVQQPLTLEPSTLDPGRDLPAYLIENGWIPYTQGLRAHNPTLIQLVALPSPRMVDTWPDDSEGHCIEEGLLVLSNFFRLYLLTANTRVNSCHETVRDEIVSE